MVLCAGCPQDTARIWPIPGQDRTQTHRQHSPDTRLLGKENGTLRRLRQRAGRTTQYLRQRRRRRCLRPNSLRRNTRRGGGRNQTSQTTVMGTAAFKPGQKTKIPSAPPPQQAQSKKQYQKGRKPKGPKRALSFAQAAKRKDWKEKYEEHRKSAHQRGYDQFWRAAREKFLQENPECEYCGTGANVVHHSVPHRGDMKLFWEKHLWVACCKTCHDRITRSGG